MKGKAGNSSSHYDKQKEKRKKSEKTNAARTRHYNKKQENTLVFDEQHVDEVPKTDESAEHCTARRKVVN